MKKAFIPIFLSFILLSGSVGIAEAASLTQSQISAIIGLLRSFGADEGIIANVNASLTGTGGGTQQWCHTFNTNLRIWDRGDEVSPLQQALDKEGFRDVASEWMGSGGVAVGFGEVTAAAVTGFQEKYRSEILTPLGLKYGTGYVGKSTRAKLNALYGCGVTKPPASAGYLEIEPSSASLAVGGSVSMQAMYQPPMPKCPEGASCAQVMPDRFPVEAEWTSNNPSVASIISIAIADTTGQPFNTVTIKGNSNGTADINALYNSPYGTDKVLTATAKVTVGKGPSVSYLTVLSPNGRESWTKGTTQTIKWQDNTPVPTCPIGAQCAPQAPKYWDIKLVPYDPPCTVNVCPRYYVAPYTIANSVYGSSYNWSVGKIVNYEGISGIIAPDDGSYTVQICQTGTSICDSSDSYFKIIGGTTTNNSPVINGIPAISSDIKVGQSVSFSWGATDADGDNLAWGVSWGEGTGVAGACQSPNPQNKQNWNFMASHAWAKSGTYTVKATVNDCRGGSNEHTFNVTVGSVSSVPSITVISPNGGEAFIKGQSYFIRWAQTGFASDGWIQLQLRDAANSSAMVKLITSSVPLGTYAGSFNWTVPTDIPDGKYLIWATAGSGLDSLGTRVLGSDFSDAAFTIVAP